MAESGVLDIEWIEEPASVKPRTSHIRSCCAEGCRSKGYRLLVDGERVQYFPFPLYDFDLCNRWASALHVDTLLPYEKLFVCSKHFRLSDYKARTNDESKKTLRRTAIPSLEPVVGLTPSRTTKRRPAAAAAGDESSEESAEESGADMKVITTLVTKKAADGDNLAVLMVKDANESEGAAAAVPSTSQAPEDDLPPIMKERKKLPLIVEDLLEAGPPYPWRKQGIEQWVNERMPHHEEQLQKTRDSITDETVASATAEQDCQERMELLALIIIKKGEGRLTLKNFVRAILD